MLGGSCVAFLGNLVLGGSCVAFLDNLVLRRGEFCDLKFIICFVRTCLLDLMDLGRGLRSVVFGDPCSQGGLWSLVFTLGSTVFTLGSLVLRETCTQEGGGYGASCLCFTRTCLLRSPVLSAV